MTDVFDISGLLAVLDRTNLDLSIVTLRIENAPEVPDGRTVEGRYLDLDTALRTRFRTGLHRSLNAIRNRAIDDYEAGWVSIGENLADADVAELDGLVLRVVCDAMRNEVDKDFDASASVEEQREAADADLVEAAGYDDLIVGAYAVVLEPANEPTAVFLRKRDPVERLTRNQFTAKLSRARLDKIDDVFIFDSGFDVVVWKDRALIKNSGAFESIFLSDTIRKAGARRALETLTARVTVANANDLDDVIESDSRFAGRLRAIERRGQLDELDISAVRRTTERFGIEHRMLRGDQLIFLPKWRFIWLAALEDSLVESPGTGKLSVARVRSEWRRREVKCVERGPRGEVLALVGDWGRAETRDVIRRLKTGTETYFVELADGRGEIDFDVSPSTVRLVAFLGEDETDRFPAIPTCRSAAQGE